MRKKKKIEEEIDEELEEELEEVEEEIEEDIEEEKPHKKYKILNYILFIILIIIFIVVYSKYIGTKGLKVKEYRVDSTILSSNFSGLKVVHFSDLLYKSTVNIEDLNNLVKRINELNPDIVVFTGDLVNKNVKVSDKDIETLKTQLTRINSKLGKYAIYGDADYSLKKYEDIMTSSNFKILNNSYDEIYYKSNDAMYIVGLPSSIKEKVNIDEAFSFYNDEERRFIITLVHDGNTIKYIDDSNYEVDMILGGHSLNGSVIIPFYGGLLKENNTYKYSEPEYSKGITKIFISSGIGTNNYGYRFLNKPSFNLYRLKAQS